MWGDRFLFVTAALAAMAVWVSVDYQRSLKSTSRRRVQYYLGPSIAAALIIIVVAGRIYAYRGDWQWPTVSSFIAVLIGAVFGSFTAKFVASLFNREFGRRDPIIGACVLLLLSVGYSLPLYGEAISSLFGKVGVSAVKTPFLELSFEAQNKGRGAVPQASGANSNSHGEAVPRTNDPKPGLEWLSTDVRLSTEVIAGGTVDSDDDYIKFIEGNPRGFDLISRDARQLLLPIRALSKCLDEYVGIIPDSQLLLVDIKPIIESLYRLHARAKRALDPKHASPRLVVLASQGAPAPAPLSESISGTDLKVLLDSAKEVMNNVNKNFGEDVALRVPECDTAGPSWGQLTKLVNESKISLTYLQPYASLILADLLVTHGAADEAISVLAEWLDLWRINQERRPDLQRPANLPEWFPLRVRSRISILMSNLAGSNNRAYRTFFSDYKNDLERYISGKQHALSRDNFSDSCDRWLKLSKDRGTKNSDLIDASVEQRIFFLLLQYENEWLRTEMSFLAEETQFETLDKLYNRALVLSKMGATCFIPLSNNDLRLQLSDDEQRAFDRRLQLSDTDQHAFVADGHITAGLVALAVANRMGSIARSSGDRELARDVRRRGEEELRSGWRDLGDLVKKDRKRIQDKILPERIFLESQWERSANLATRALSQLRSEGD